jgi:heat shock protein HslJ
MKKSLITIAMFLFVVVAFSFADENSRVNLSPSENGYRRVNLNDIQGKNWRLAEVKRGYDVIAAIDRTNTPVDIYTMKFEAARLSGTGGLNTYSAAYSVDENYNLSIRGITSTRMNPIFQMKTFSENEYFKCLNNVKTWYTLGKNLILYTYPEDDYDNPIILVFS